MKDLLVRSSLLGCLLAPTLLACAGGEPTTQDPTRTSSAGLDDPSGTLAGSVRCTYAYRESHEVLEGQTGEEPAFQFEERVLTVAADQEVSETLGQLTFGVGFHTWEGEGDSVRVSVAAGDTSLLSILYQLTSALPHNQFAGGHGFTGLLYFTHPTAGGDYQAFCESVR